MMFAEQLFRFKEIVEQLQNQRTVSVAGFVGSTLELFIIECARLFPHIMFITDETYLTERTQALKILGADAACIDGTHSLYTQPAILATTDEYIHRDVIDTDTMNFAPHHEINIEELRDRLVLTGLTREDIVEEEGEFALRGGIVDIFMPDGLPIRLEFFGDEVVSMRTFDVHTQRSIEAIEWFTIRLAKKAAPVPLIQLLTQDTIIVSEKPVDLPFRSIYINQPGGVQYDLAPARQYFGDLKRLRQDIETQEYTYKFLLRSTTLSDRLKSLLGDVETYVLPVSEGFIDETHKTMFLAEQEIFGTVLKKKRDYKGPFIDDLMGLKEGDYVVHTDYGIGQYRGLTMVTVEDTHAECLQIDYAGHDKVYLPIERLNLIERYVATSDRPPRLSRLGSELWLRTKKRIKKATERLALDLLNLYSRRSQEKGFAFAQDSVECHELEASFPYVETKDQLQAIDDVKADMEMAKPAERLVCGDVGYGKTEIALRAAFKAALAGKQTMLLCPTTLLAFQHYHTFKNRLQHFPVNVEMVSRFQKREELQQIIRDISHGRVDIVIGTHRLLQPDIHFKDLGLLIIDEEQRFGVAQKEKIKKIKPSIDCFYLSATPIPRTLYMALTGLKNISNIYTPPPGRKDIVTRVMYYDEEELKKAISLELERGGQIFFVHNRIQTIHTIERRLHSIMPELTICVLHGKVSEEIIARRMVEFLDGKYQVLLSTAIVESGIDMPHVNTIIVDEAHTFGLADLHQLRGRVGRSHAQAYAYFIVPSHRSMTDEAHKRLGALASYTTLGSGFRLAIRDMEIRGVGNLLGKEQSGHINAIGYHLYLHILSHTIDELRGRRSIYEPVLDLKMDAYLPSAYIESAYERTALYKRVLAAESLFEIESIKKEITDRFGHYPEEVKNLFRLAEIRVKAREIGATEVVRKGDSILYYREGKIVRTDGK